VSSPQVGPPRQIHSEAAATLSVKLAEWSLLWLMVVLAVFTLATHLSQTAGLSFRLYAYSSTLAAIAASLPILRAAWIDLRQDGIRRDYGATALVCAIGVSGALLTLIANKPDADDYSYVPSAVYHLTNPDAPMDHLVHALGAVEAPIISYVLNSMPFEYMQAAFAFLLHAEYLDLYYLVVPALTGFLIPLALFFLLSHFAKRTVLVAAATLATLLVLLLLGDTHRTIGNFLFTRAYQGKTVSMTIGLFVFTAYSLRYCLESSLRTWTRLLLAATAMAGVTTSSIFLMPPLAIILAIAMSFLGWRRLGPKGAATLLVGNVSSCAYLVAYALLIRQATAGLVVGHSVGWPTSFWGHAAFFYNRERPVTVVALVFFSCCGLLLAERGARALIGVWMALAVLLYLNPVSGALLIGSVASPFLYWRMFYLYPLTLLVGVFFLGLYRNAPRSRRTLTVLCAQLLLLLLYLPGWSTSALGDHVEYGAPGYKLPKRALSLAREAIAVAPPGTMLAPPELCGVIPMLSARFPQAHLRPDWNILWLGEQEGVMRLAASEFVGGQLRYWAAFRDLLVSRTISSIVIKSGLLQDAGVRGLLASRGFAEDAELPHGYVIAWRPPDGPTHSQESTGSVLGPDATP
jgi:hypothetical protein